MAARAIGLSGDRKLGRILKKLKTPAAMNRVLRRPTSAALTPIAKAAKQNAPVGRGYLKKSLGKKVKAYRGGVWGGVGPRVGEKFTYIDENGKKHVPANYAHFPEYGTARMPAQPYLRPALDSQRPNALRILRTGAWKNIEKEIAKG